MIEEVTDEDEVQVDDQEDKYNDEEDQSKEEVDFKPERSSLTEPEPRDAFQPPITMSGLFLSSAILAIVLILRYVYLCGKCMSMIH